jgi:glyoxylase-like metal-dependent hydrolase (beta-lactamase superfamily II)
VSWPPKNLIFEHLVTGPLETNCYILGCSLSRETLIIDPGAMLESQLKEVRKLMGGSGLRVKHIVNTHGHADHIAGNRRLKEITGATVLIHSLDAPKLTDASLNGSSLFGVAVVSPPADELLEDGSTVRFGQSGLGVIHTPGHTPGSISLLGDGYLFTGDTLFSGSIGVIEHPNGTPNPSADYSVEVDSIRERLLTLPDNTKIFPGHGPFSTMGRERKYNLFLS